MKKLSICCLAVMACLMMVISATAQNVSRNVSGYTGIECSGPFEVKIKIDGTESLRLEGDPNLTSLIQTEVEDGVLKVAFLKSWRYRRNVGRINVYITARQLRYLGNSGSGNVEVQGMMKGESVQLAVSGSGQVRAAVKVRNLEVNTSGSGSITLAGITEKATVSLSGSGGINARQLNAQMLTASISGSGGVNMVVNKSVTARISGSGNVNYAGNATQIDLQHSGSGRANKVNF
jgi:hypothetical protein